MCCSLGWRLPTDDVCPHLGALKLQCGGTSCLHLDFVFTGSCQGPCGFASRFSRRWRSSALLSFLQEVLHDVCMMTTCCCMASCRHDDIQGLYAAWSMLPDAIHGRLGPDAHGWHAARCHPSLMTILSLTLCIISCGLWLADA